MSKITKNAVLFKEMTVDMKQPKIMLILVCVNTIMSLLAGLFMLIVGVSDSSVDYRAFALYFIIAIYVEVCTLAAITPAITAGTVSLEKERQTLDVLLTTKLKPWDIILGKYLSQVFLLVLLMLSTLPLLSLVFVYGGVSIIGLFAVLLCMIVFVAFVSAFGVFFSSLTKNTVSSVILSYVVFIVYSLMTVLLPAVGIIVVELINVKLEDIFFYIPDHFLNGDFLVFIGTLNPFCLIYDVLGNSLGYSFENAEGIEGMVSLSRILPHFNPSNNWTGIRLISQNIGVFLLRLWTPISIVVQLLITFILLKLSAFNLNPIKGRKKNKSKSEKKKVQQPQAEK